MHNEKPTASIFINYRRENNMLAASTIHDELTQKFGQGSVFLDQNHIIPGDFWDNNIEAHLRQARILLALIDPNWLKHTDPKSGRRRIDQAHDWVRKEIAHFLEARQNGADKFIIPVLLGEHAVFPDVGAELPSDIAGLLRCQHFRIRVDNNLKDDIPKLVEAIKSHGIAALQPAAQRASSPSVHSLEAAYPLPKLSLLDARRIPAPYVGLHYFTEKDAHIYFGRDNDVFDLITQLMQPDYRLCFLYGPSGVGKSSLLNAGLLPRIKGHFRVYGPERRSFEKGLDTQLQEILDKVHAGPDHLPRLIILDQVEEMFTHSNPQRPQEAPGFFAALARTLRTDPEAPRFLLCFRYEHFTKIRQPIDDAGLEYSEVALNPLDKTGVRMAIEGVLRREPLPQRFNLHIVPELIDEMTEAVCKDQESHIAPLLELQLRSMWDEAVKWGTNNPVFDINLYRIFSQSRLPQMLDYLLARLDDRWQPALESGLVLSLLHRFVTSRGTAGSARTDELLDAYRHIPDFAGLLQALENCYLLIALPDGERYRLAHDSLAPIVQDKYQSSDLPGQRAYRIIETKARDLARNHDLAFSEVDLKIIRDGQPGMPAIDAGLLARIERDEAHYRAEREKNFRLAFESAEKAVEHLDYDKALNDLQLAAGHGIHPDEALRVARELPYPLALMGKEEAWRKSIELVVQLYGNDAAPDWCNAVTLQSFEKILKNDAGIWQHLQEQFFPNLINIPAGEFEMGVGDEEPAYPQERPLHSVEVGSFQLADTPVTCLQYGLFCSVTGRPLPNDSGFGRGRRPVINVCWYDAIAYCNWLSRQMGFTPVYRLEDLPPDPDEWHLLVEDWGQMIDWEADGFRLPTDAEWEYAAGGGAENRSKFGNGKDMADPDEMNFDAASPSNKQAVEFGWMKEIRKGSFLGATTPVGHFQKSNENPFGLHDMSGNVYEWCWDWYSEGDYYKQCKEQGKAVDPKGPGSGDYRVVRGGSWNLNPNYCRVSYRLRVHPLVRTSMLVFGCPGALNNP